MQRFNILSAYPIPKKCENYYVFLTSYTKFKFLYHTDLCMWLEGLTEVLSDLALLFLYHVIPGGVLQYCSDLKS